MKLLGMRLIVIMYCNASFVNLCFVTYHLGLESIFNLAVIHF